MTMTELEIKTAKQIHQDIEQHILNQNFMQKDDINPMEQWISRKTLLKKITETEKPSGWIISDLIDDLLR